MGQYWLDAVWEFACSERKKGNNLSPSGQFFYAICTTRAADSLQLRRSAPWCSPQFATMQTKGPARAHRVLPLHPHQHMRVRCHMQVLFKHEIRIRPTEHVEMESEKCFCILLLRYSHRDQRTAQLFPRSESLWWLLFSNFFATDHHPPHTQYSAKAFSSAFFKEFKDMHQTPFRDSNIFWLRSSFNCSSK